jgi:hypothetical protein
VETIRDLIAEFGSDERSEPSASEIRSAEKPSRIRLNQHVERGAFPRLVPVGGDERALAVHLLIVLLKE